MPKTDYEDESMDALLDDQVRIRQIMAKRKAERLSQHSFILNKRQQTISQEEKNLENSLSNLMEKHRRKLRFKRELEKASVFSSIFWQNVIVTNIDLFTTTFVELNALALTYPLQTIKTRIQSRHFKQDVCHFIKNNVEKAPMHKGLFSALCQVLIGNTIHFGVSKIVDYELMAKRDMDSYYKRKLLSYMIADIISSPFRLAFDIRKMLRQMNVPEITFKQQLNGYKMAFVPFLLRDLLFRFTLESIYHFTIFYDFMKRRRELKKVGLDNPVTFSSQINYEYSQPQHKRLGLFIISSFLACAVTMPLDVIVTRVVTQQSYKYNGFFDCLKTIVREEGLKKLVSGLGPRSGFFFINGTILLALTPRLKPMILEAYAVD